MHELPITEGILEISLRHAEAAQATHITDIHVVIGQLSSFVDDSIQMYWDIISAGTIAVGAILHFRRIAAEVRCGACQHIYPLNTPDFKCPHCGGLHGEIITGDELYVESIEVLEGERDEQATYSNS
jgi:hydrogenase nickel incorporation protein HypA/HybF